MVTLKGWRKWSIAMTALVLGFVLALFGKLTTEFATIASITVGSFVGANAYVHQKQAEK